MVSGEHEDRPLAPFRRRISIDECETEGEILEMTEASNGLSE
jgi:hypothetical protein